MDDPRISGHGHTHGGVAGAGHMSDAGDRGRPRGDSTPIRAQHIVSKGFGIYAGGASLKVDQATLEKTDKSFRIFKEALIAKYERDHGGHLDYESTDVHIEFGTYTAHLMIGAKKVSVALTEMEDLDDAGSENSLLYRTAREFEAVLGSEKLLRPSGVTHLGEDDDDYEYMLGDKNGPDGIKNAIGGMAPDCKSRLERLPLDEISEGLFEAAGRDPKDGANAAAIDEVNATYEKLKTRKQDLIRVLRDAHKDLQADLDQQKAAGTITPVAEKMMIKELNAMSSKVASLQTNDAEDRALMMSLTLRALVSIWGGEDTTLTTQDLVQDADELLAVYLKDEVGLGVSTRDKTTGAASVNFSKPYRQFTTLVAAGAVFSYTDEGDSRVRARGYNRYAKLEYQEYLERNKIDPKTHLGEVGSLLRLSSDFESHSLAHAKSNMRAMFMPRGLSPLTERAIMDGAVKAIRISEETEYLVRQGINKTQANSIASNTFYLVTTNGIDLPEARVHAAEEFQLVEVQNMDIIEAEEQASYFAHLVVNEGVADGNARTQSINYTSLRRRGQDDATARANARY